MIPLSVSSFYQFLVLFVYSFTLFISYSLASQESERGPSHSIRLSLMYSNNSQLECFEIGGMIYFIFIDDDVIKEECK